MELLRWKDGQRLVFWMLDDEYQYDENDTMDMSKIKKNANNKYENQLIAPFWKYFSQKLTNLYDPVCRANYNPLSGSNGSFVLGIVGKTGEKEA